MFPYLVWCPEYQMAVADMRAVMCSSAIVKLMG
jgi:hypothetical protein